MQQSREALACLRYFCMALDKRLLTNRERTSVERPGLLTLALHLPQESQIVHGLSQVEMSWSQVLLPDV